MNSTSTNFIIYASDADGNIIECIALNRIDRKNGEIKKFFVHPAYRGKYVAQKLMSTLLKAACVL